MPNNSAVRSVHLSGEAANEELTVPGPSAVDTFGGKVFVRWDADASVTGFGPAAYFIEFLKANGAMGAGLPIALHEPECSTEARHPGDDNAFGGGGSQAIRTYHHGTQ